MVKIKYILLLLLAILLIIALNINAIDDSIGKYSVKPSFKVGIAYNPFNDYNKLVKEINGLSVECPRKADIIECINNRINTFNSMQGTLILSLGSCDKGAKKIFYDFIENYELCANSQDSDCICEFSLDFSRDYALKGEYKIKLSKDMLVKLEKPESFVHILDNVPSYTGNTPDELEERDYVDYFINYNDGSFNAKLGLERAGLPDKEWSYNTIKIYKRDDGKLVFVKDDAGKDKCMVTRNVFKFCAVNTKKQFYVYDPNIDQEKPTLQNPVIKFALYMEEFPPPPIENLAVYDKKNSDKTAIIKWDKSKATDVKQYHIYYSKDNFLGWEIKNREAINKNKKIIPIVVNAKIKNENKFKAIDLTPLCQFYEADKKCSFLFSVIKEDGSSGRTELKNNEAYLVGEKYIYILNLKSDEDYNFAVTAVDIAGNEIDNANEKFKLVQGKNYAQGKAEDDLDPSIVELNEPQIKTKNNKKVVELTWSKPPNNIDGTPNVENDIKYYNVYYEKSDFGSVDTLQVKSTSDSISIDIDINSLEKDKEYYFAVTAVDNNNNEFKERVVTRKIKT